MTKKVLGVVEELQSALIYLPDEIQDDVKSATMIACLRLKLSVLEGSQDALIIKTISLMFTPDLLWIRLCQIYETVFGQKQDPSRPSDIVTQPQAIAVAAIATNRLYSGSDYSLIVKEALYIVIWMN